MAVIALAVVGVLAAAGSAYVAYRASEQQAQQQRYQAKVVKNQATAEAYNAQIRAESQAVHNRRVMGAQAAALGASGVQPGEGTPLFVQMDSFEEGRLEETRLLYGGQVRSEALTSESRYLKHQATQTRETGLINSGVTLLGGTARAGAGAYAGYSAGAGTNTDYGTGYQDYRRGERQRY